MNNAIRRALAMGMTVAMGGWNGVIRCGGHTGDGSRISEY